jgi:metal-responsive CopG/Arc/MetJ family transcriptional regulator
MPPALDPASQTARVDAKMPKALIALIDSWLDDGENRSDFLRKAAAAEVTRRARLRDPNPPAKPRNRKP